METAKVKHGFVYAQFVVLGSKEPYELCLGNSFNDGPQDETSQTLRDTAKEALNNAFNGAFTDLQEKKLFVDFGDTLTDLDYTDRMRLSNEVVSKYINDKQAGFGRLVVDVCSVGNAMGFDVHVETAPIVGDVQMNEDVVRQAQVFAKLTAGKLKELWHSIGTEDGNQVLMMEKDYSDSPKEGWKLPDEDNS